jgi:hypothetical protein
LSESQRHNHLSINLLTGKQHMHRVTGLETQAVTVWPPTKPQGTLARARTEGIRDFRCSISSKTRLYLAKASFQAISPAGMGCDWAASACSPVGATSQDTLPPPLARARPQKCPAAILPAALGA